MKTFRPRTKSLRKTAIVTYRGVLSTNKPKKSLTTGFSRGSGRNSFGRITSSHRGGGHKRAFREIDFSMQKFNIPAKVETVEYDPNRSGFIALICYKDGDRRYTLLPKGLKVGDEIIVSEDASLKIGNRLPLRKTPVGTFVFNIEVEPHGGARIARSAGIYAEVVANNDGQTHLKMPSGEIRKVSENAWASIGAVSNEEYKHRNLGKAGRSRWLGIRPKVRGTAMNPVDHPYGGGEGRQGRGTKRPKTRSGKITGGRKTRTPKKYSNNLIVERRKHKETK
ncbi:MAG: 50S ribosomal protein L2 [Candidatus Pacebacteria bacterium]|nr:50S ribosomal protein L2 [Candidatus Paceibacterota bacterium]